MAVDEEKVRNSAISVISRISEIISENFGNDFGNDFGNPENSYFPDCSAVL
jgi:hypothetical protein